MTRLIVLMMAFLCVWPRTGMARQTPPDTLTLHAVRAATTAEDARSVQPELLTEASQLRLMALRAMRGPRVSLMGQGTIQSDVPGIPVSIPGQALPVVPHEQFRTGLDAELLLYDGQRTRRQGAAERARLAQELAGVAVTARQLREVAMETFYSVRLLDARLETLRLAATDMDVQLDRLERQAQEGAMLAAHVDLVRAERIRIGQQQAEVASLRRAARRVLAQLTGLPVGDTTVLLPADLTLPAHPDAEPIQRPELVQLARAADRARAEAAARAAEGRPTISLFGQAGVGSPNPYNMFSDELSEYGMAGIRLQWSVFDGGRIRKQARALTLQASIAESESDAFRQQVRRAVTAETETLAFLDDALASDREVVALREQILAVTRAQLEQGVVLPETYTDRVTDLAQARLDLARHELEREQTLARILSMLGILDR